VIQETIRSLVSNSPSTNTATTRIGARAQITSPCQSVSLDLFQPSANDIPSSSNTTDPSQDEKAARKSQKEKEKEEREARLKQEEEEREQRRKEKQELMEAAKKLKEDEDKAREERARLRNEKEMKKKAEEDAAAAAEAEAKAKRREEREMKKKQKEEEKRQLELERRLQWIETAKEDQWTQQEQDLFEEALLTSPMILSTAGNSTMQKEKEAKWNFIASLVGTKNRNQCLTRYKLLLLLGVDEMEKGRGGQGDLKIAR
jgi:hypothetical protein